MCDVPVLKIGSYLNNNRCCYSALATDFAGLYLNKVRNFLQKLMEGSMQSTYD